ncbi:MAG: hypothetical protein KKB74_00520 [Bacteroidetes bacterium]|nr:hypothetical protein [Bacteroidota bacterium]
MSSFDGLHLKGEFKGVGVRWILVWWMDLFVLEVWLPGTGRPGEGLNLAGQEREAG